MLQWLQVGFYDSIRSRYEVCDENYVRICFLERGRDIICIHIYIFIYKESMHCEYMNHLYSFLVASLVGEILPFNVTKKTDQHWPAISNSSSERAWALKKKPQNSAKKKLRQSPIQARNAMAWGQWTVIIVAILAISEALRLDMVGMVGWYGFLMRCVFD